MYKILTFLPFPTPKLILERLSLPILLIHIPLDHSHPVPVRLGLEEKEGVWDERRQFKTQLFAVTGSQWSALSSTRLLCLGAQTSLDRLHHLTELLTNWSGPVSISVFTPDIELGLTVTYIQYLQSCLPAMARVSFHLTVPADRPGLQDPALEVGEGWDCQQPRLVLERILQRRGEDMMSWRESYPYPQNLLRNTAKRGCQTNYTFIPDIDMVPTPGMDLHLETFLQKDQETNNCTKCAFVIPTYEISSKSEHLPRTKEELLTFIKEKEARQFHLGLLNQMASNLRRWERIPESRDLEVAYKVEKYIFMYEPVYVARADTPDFDERFIGFGMTRTTQLYEMYVAGYKFFLLNNVFTSHWGFLSLSSRPQWRYKQQWANNLKFKGFAEEVRENVIESD